ncbi:paraquat-inducible membrane protein A [Paroceanicella profunda]|uniref:Paraquat-inducible membrane protein A n=1 Tax=Paroceanicella profunda TaxID=2579971 RepID=A0A5B8FI67_9RHOB|nr:paraquat-inducible protein A [Paroceanicella profunda]QDL93391.1 paraquat-inducible membrane protein A [Paroceanicella profunda]
MSPPTQPPTSVDEILGTTRAHRAHDAPVLTARAAGLVGCTICGKVERTGVARCPRCGAQMQSRPRGGMQPVWAWFFAGLVFYIPANLYPMLITRTLGQEMASTIIGGALELIEYGSWGVGIIVLVASVGIPIGKFFAIALLALAVDNHWRMDKHRLLQLYEVVEFIGRWSMIDIFVVAVLSALVQLGFVASLSPGPAAACFASSVAFTMLSARAFDTRLIWDRIGEQSD